MNKQGETYFTEGPISSALLKFVIPILGALFLQAAYGAADLIIVGRFGEASDVSAVGTGTSIMQLITFAIVGVAMGATIAIGQNIGEGLLKEAGDTIGTSMILFAFIALVATAGMECFAVNFVQVMQTPVESFEKTVEYVRICSSGLIFIVSYNVISSIFRGLGNSNLPFIFVFIACVVNIAADLLLVGYYNLGVIGAAIATIVAQAISVILSFLIIINQKLPFPFSLGSIHFRIDKASEILLFGCPIALQDVLVQISFLVINAIVNHMGLAESAGYGISARIQSFIMLVPSATMQGVSAFVAQNVGAGKLKRAKKTLYTSIRLGLTAGLFLFTAGFFGAPYIVAAFTKDSEVIIQAVAYLRGFSPDCLLTCILFSCIGFFNGRGETIYVMLQGITSAMLVRIPIAFILAHKDGATLMHVALGVPITTIYGIVFCYLCLRHSAKKHLLLTNMEQDDEE